MDIKPFPNKQAIRLKNYDYSSPGTYFVTICTENRKNLLSEMKDIIEMLYKKSVDEINYDIMKKEVINMIKKSLN